MKYILRRLAFYVVTLWIAVTLNFAIPRLLPGNPVDIIFGKMRGQVSPGTYKAIKAALGFTNQNLVGQYFTYLWNLVHGNFGLSYSYFPVSVLTIIRQDLPWTLFLFGLSTIIAFTLGTGLGILSAWKRGSFLDSTLPPMMLFLSSFPYFWTALLLLYVFGITLGWFPNAHAYSVLNLSWPVIGTILYHSILPAATIVISSTGGWLLGMRNVMVSTLAEDYITMAQAKGLSDRRVMLMYAARNAILPSITGFAMSLGFVVGGQVLVETVFSYPGVGFDLVNAATNDDFPLLQALLLFIVLAVLVANFIADITYVRLDPRVRAEA
ncbi:MAG TPA: ABC transporter permease [Chloroflexota bacterium]|jgi:peptide/nickel transport system permease protein|nr:ABC transporter permease [Chloroflexota bacterium]